MVHRIQNRNPGYSDFANNSSSQSFTFSNPNNSIITHGANALKLEEEAKSENLEISDSNDLEISNVNSNSIEEIKHQNLSAESTLDHIEKETDKPASNGLENFHIDEEDTPELFSSDSPDKNESESLSPELSENSEEDDDLEIPAFLRRQKN